MASAVPAPLATSSRIEACSRLSFRPTLLAGLGGIANFTLLVQRAQLWERMGCLPQSARWLGIDFETDPPIPPAQMFADEIEESTWQHAQFKDSELALLRSDLDCQDLAARMRAEEPDVAWICQLISPDAVEQYTGGEAAQVPAYARLFLLASATRHDSNGQPNWLEKLQVCLQSLSPRGDAITRVQREMKSANVVARPAVAALVAGDRGGTGVGVTLAIAGMLKWLAAKIGLKLRVDLHLISGDYRPADGRENRKAAISHMHSLDIEFVMTKRGLSVQIPFGPNPNQRARVTGLVDNVWRYEATERLGHNQRAIASIVARSLNFGLFSRAGFELEKRMNNTDVEPRLRALEEE